MRQNFKIVKKNKNKFIYLSKKWKSIQYNYSLIFFKSKKTNIIVEGNILIYYINIKSSLG